MFSTQTDVQTQTVVELHYVFMLRAANSITGLHLGKSHDYCMVKIKLVKMITCGQHGEVALFNHVICRKKGEEMVHSTAKSREEG